MSRDPGFSARPVPEMSDPLRAIVTQLEEELATVRAAGLALERFDALILREMMETLEFYGEQWIELLDLAGGVRRTGQIVPASMLREDQGRRARAAAAFLRGYLEDSGVLDDGS